MKHDAFIITTWLATGVSFVAAHFNALVGGVIAVITLGIVILRFRREWKHRNDPPPEGEI